MPTALAEQMSEVISGWEAAVEAGSSHASGRLALAFHYGRGVAADQKKALSLFQKAG